MVIKMRERELTENMPNCQSIKLKYPLTHKVNEVIAKPT